jgi:hypothetical protein
MKRCGSTFRWKIAVKESHQNYNRTAEAVIVLPFLNGFEYILTEWLTPKECVKQYNLASISVISNWIKRRIIPKEDIVESKSLNGLKLIRNKVYKQK